jgi:predicted methyltransferase family protein
MNAAWQPFYSVDVADELADVGLRFVGSATLAENHPALVLDADSATAVAALPTDRQRQLAEDFAVNRRFRRDVFVRDSRSTAATTERLHATAIGSARPPSAIPVKATVPRGEIAFHEGFIRDVRTLMTRGSITIGDAVASLSGRGGNAHEILRNLIFLVAAGVLIPFAKARTVGDGAARRRHRATPMLERALAHAIETGKGCSAPSEVMGNGFPLSADEARAVRDELAGRGRVDEQARELIATLVRIGLLM